jgi:hypothetical protein
VARLVAANSSSDEATQQRAQQRQAADYALQGGEQATNQTAYERNVAEQAGEKGKKHWELPQIG